MSIRRYPRIRTDLVAELADVTGNGEDRYVRVRELGQGGALIHGEAKLQSGRVVVLVIHFPKGKVRMIAQALYGYPAKKGFANGMLFESAEAETPALLLDYIDTMLPTNAIFLPGESK